VYRNAVPGQIKELGEQYHLDASEQESIAKYVLAAGVAYASFAATRFAAVEPGFKKSFGIPFKPIMREAEAPSPADQAIAQLPQHDTAKGQVAAPH
jgi:hypothetical protein